MQKQSERQDRLETLECTADGKYNAGSKYGLGINPSRKLEKSEKKMDKSLEEKMPIKGWDCKRC